MSHTGRPAAAAVVAAPILKLDYCMNLAGNQFVAEGSGEHL